MFFFSFIKYYFFKYLKSNIPRLELFGAPRSGYIVILVSVADPDPEYGIRCLFDRWVPDPGWVKNQDPDPGSGMNIQDLIFEIFVTGS